MHCGVHGGAPPSQVLLSPQCLQHLDVSVLGELVPRLCELLRSGVGLGTKVLVLVLEVLVQVERF